MSLSGSKLRSKVSDFNRLLSARPSEQGATTKVILLQNLLFCNLGSEKGNRKMATIHRVLTLGETSMLKSVFGGGITYTAVKVHNHRFIFFQPGDTAMTPNGQIYFPEAHYLADFSTASLGDRAWFIHEGAHLYQHYGLGWNLIARAPFDREYSYTLDPKKTQLKEYGLEQMGAIAQDYYTLKNGGSISKAYKLADYAGLLPIP